MLPENRIKDSDVIKFITQNKLGMTTNEVRINFGIRYEKALNILENLMKDEKIEKYLLGNQTMWKLMR